MTRLNGKKNNSDDLRSLIISKYNEGKSYGAISSDLNVPKSTVASTIKIFVNTGRIECIKDKIGRPKCLNSDMINYIKHCIDEDASTTIKVIQANLLNVYALTVSRSIIDRAIADFCYSFKRLVLVPAARNTTRAIETRYVYAHAYLRLNEEKVLFLDEFGVNCSIRKSYGRSLIGTSPRKEVRSIRSKNMSVSAAITRKGPVYYEVRNRPYNGESFCDYVEELMQIMVLKSMHKFTLIMDNCSIHKVSRCKGIIENAGHSLTFLPPYSPQLNPIEETFSKWKSYVRAQNVSTEAELEVAIEAGNTSINESDCVGFFNHTREFCLKALAREEF